MPVKNFSISLFSIVLLISSLFSGLAIADDFDLSGAMPTPFDKNDTLGNPNSPITIVEYGDYQCPFCVEFYLQIEPRLKTEYINTGKAKLIYRNQQFLGAESIKAAAAAECAKDQGKFWVYHDELYAAKASDFKYGGGSENDDFYKRSLFLQLARQINLNMNAFTSCIDNNKYDSQVQMQSDEASSMGINTIPTVYVNGKEVINPLSFAAYQKIINQ